VNHEVGFRDIRGTARRMSKWAIKQRVFCRATLCVSAVPDVWCLSVRLSLVSKRLKKHQTFSWPDSPIILVFEAVRCHPLSRRIPSATALSTPRWEAVAIFDWNRPLSQIKSNQFISETADSKIEIQDNDNVQPLTEVQKGCCQDQHPT